MSALWAPKQIATYFETHRRHIRKLGIEAMEAPADKHHVMVVQPRVTRTRGDNRGFQSLFTATDDPVFQAWYVNDIAKGQFTRMLLISFDGLRQVKTALDQQAM